MTFLAFETKSTLHYTLIPISFPILRSYGVISGYILQILGNSKNRMTIVCLRHTLTNNLLFSIYLIAHKIQLNFIRDINFLDWNSSYIK